MRTMYDSIESTVTELPDGADLYAGYDDGHWPDATPSLRGSRARR
jgi:hypothetical protein